MKKVIVVFLLVCLFGCNPLGNLTPYRKNLSIINVYCHGKFVERAPMIIDTKTEFSTLIGWKLDKTFTKSMCTYKKEGSYIITYIYNDVDPSPEFTIEESYE